MLNKILWTALVLVQSSVALRSACRDSSCKFIPGDWGWPSPADWEQLNTTVNGRLIDTVQTGRVCHDPDFNETSCQALQQNWDYPEAHIGVPGEFMATWFQNSSCDPYSPRSKPCELGNYVSYSINVTGADDVVAGIQFARKKNIRLVVQNTGHDYLGKSTGKGGLALWTYNLKSASIIPNYRSARYSGSALRIGAGVTAAQAYTTAHAKGYRVVGGTCASVGLAGGYSQGGGHSVLSGKYGLGADNVLEWEVVTPNGQHVIATPSRNSELYWALSGGGPGTFGVVLSMTTKLHQESSIAAGILSFDDSQVGQDVFWKATELFLTKLPSLLADGSSFLYTITDSTFGGMFTMFDQTENDVKQRLGVVTDGLSQLGLNYSLTTTSSDSYFNYFTTMFGPLPNGPFTAAELISSRIIPKSSVQPDNVHVLGEAIRHVTANKYFSLGCIGTIPSHEHAGNKAGDNAVLPAWRDSVSVCVVNGYWNWTLPRSEMENRERELTYEVMPVLEKATPGSGNYLNEANFAQLNWQTQFYGENYPRLLRLKMQLDPDSLMYAVTAVGSEAWISDKDGRLCRAAT